VDETSAAFDAGDSRATMIDAKIVMSKEPEGLLTVL
jgi:hypothetical protein